MVSGPTPASASASATTSAWPTTLGALKPTLSEPSLLTAEPRITARTVSPSARASASRLSTTTPAPSPNTQPRAPASKVRTCPSGDSMPPSMCRWPTRSGTRMDTPPARAMSHSPSRRLRAARCTASSEVEQNVCTAMLGPVSPSL